VRFRVLTLGGLQQRNYLDGQIRDMMRSTGKTREKLETLEKRISKRKKDLKNNQEERKSNLAGKFRS